MSKGRVVLLEHYLQNYKSFNIKFSSVQTWQSEHYLLRSVSILINFKWLQQKHYPNYVNKFVYLEFFVFTQKLNEGIKAYILEKTLNQFLKINFLKFPDLLFSVFTISKKVCRNSVRLWFEKKYGICPVTLLLEKSFWHVPDFHS